MNLKFKKLDEEALLPSYATDGSSGMDLSACLDDVVCLQPGESAIVPTGVAMELPEGYEGQIRGRSGLAFKHAVFAFSGTIDQDYRGELKVLLTNNSQVKFFIEHGDRIAQLVVNVGVVKCRPGFVNELADTVRGDGGFGSTGYGGHHGAEHTFDTKLDAVSENKGKTSEEYIAPQFRKGAPDQNEIMDNLLNAGKRK